MKIPPLRNSTLTKLAFSRLVIPASAVPQEVLDAGDRAGGNVTCPLCNELYIDHPRIEGHEGLRLTCGWDVFKI